MYLYYYLSAECDYLCHLRWNETSLRPEVKGKLVRCNVFCAASYHGANGARPKVHSGDPAGGSSHSGISVCTSNTARRNTPVCARRCVCVMFGSSIVSRPVLVELRWRSLRKTPQKSFLQHYPIVSAAQVASFHLFTALKLLQKIQAPKNLPLHSCTYGWNYSVIISPQSEFETNQHSCAWLSEPGCGPGPRRFFGVKTWRQRQQESFVCLPGSTLTRGYATQTRMCVSVRVCVFCVPLRQTRCPDKWWGGQTLNVLASAIRAASLCLINRKLVWTGWRRVVGECVRRQTKGAKKKRGDNQNEEGQKKRAEAPAATRTRVPFNPLTAKLMFSCLGLLDCWHERGRDTWSTGEASGEAQSN